VVSERRRPESRRKALAISTLLGVGSGFRDDPKKRYVHAVRGSIAS
jgi:hypothetical protein